MILQEMQMENEDFNCDICEMNFTGVNNIKNHHMIEHDKLYKCGECNKLYSKKAFFINHITKGHEKPKKFQCELCNKEFSQKDNLGTHIRAIHEKVKKACSTCGKEYSHPAALRLHITSVHEKITSRKCNQCDKSFVTKGTLSRHISTGLQI